MRYSLIDLKLFVAIADEGNVTRGAAQCFLAPSSASLRLKQLEETLGASLFTREHRGVCLTRAGQVMLEHCRRVFAELEQMHVDLTPYAKGLTSHVTLFANSTAIASFLPHDLEQFFREHPAVRVTLEERLSHDIVVAVTEGRADIGIVTWEGEHPDLVFQSYHEDALVVITPKAGFARHRRLRFADCLEHPFISLGSGTAIHTYLSGWAASMGKRLDMRIQVASFQAIEALVCSGAGIAIVPRSVLSRQDGDGLRVLELDESWAQRHLRVCTRRDGSRLSGHARALLKRLCAEAAEDV